MGQHERDFLLVAALARAYGAMPEKAYGIAKDLAAKVEALGDQASAGNFIIEVQNRIALGPDPLRGAIQTATQARNKANELEERVNSLEKAVAPKE